MPRTAPLLLLAGGVDTARLLGRSRRAPAAASPPAGSAPADPLVGPFVYSYRGQNAVLGDGPGGMTVTARLGHDVVVEPTGFNDHNWQFDDRNWMWTRAAAGAGQASSGPATASASSPAGPPSRAELNASVETACAAVQAEIKKQPANENAFISCSTESPAVDGLFDSCVCQLTSTVCPLCSLADGVPTDETLAGVGSSTSLARCAALDSATSGVLTGFSSAVLPAASVVSGVICVYWTSASAEPVDLADKQNGAYFHFSRGAPPQLRKPAQRLPGLADAAEHSETFTFPADCKAALWSAEGVAACTAEVEAAIRGRAIYVVCKDVFSAGGALAAELEVLGDVGVGGSLTSVPASCVVPAGGASGPAGSSTGPGLAASAPLRV